MDVNRKITKCIYYIKCNNSKSSDETKFKKRKKGINETDNLKDDKRKRGSESK